MTLVVAPQLEVPVNVTVAPPLLTPVTEKLPPTGCVAVATARLLLRVV